MRLGTQRLRLDDSVRECAFSEDGKQLVSVSGKGTVYTWDVATGKTIRQPARIAGRDDTRALSPDGQFIAAIGKDHICRLFDSSRGQIIREFDCGSNVEPGFHARGELFCTRSSEGLPRFWNASTGEPFPRDGVRDSQGIVALDWGTNNVQRIDAFAVLANELMAAGHLDKSIRIWNLKTGKLVRTMDVKGILSTVSPDGKFLVVRKSYDSMCLVDVSTGKQQLELKSPESRNNVLFTPDSNSLITWDNGEISRRTLQSSKAIEPPINIRSSICCLAVSKDGKKLAVGTSHRTIKMFDLINGESINPNPGPDDPATEARYLRNGEIIATGSEHSLACFWDSRTGKPVKERRESWCTLGCISADSSTTASYYNRGFSIERDGKLLCKEAPFAPVRPLAMSSNGKQFVSLLYVDDLGTSRMGPYDEKIQIRHSTSGAVLHNLGRIRAESRTFRFSPDNRTLAGCYGSLSGQVDKSFRGFPLHLWDAISGRSLAGFGNDSTRVGSFAFSPNGRFVASTEKDSKVMLRIREVFTGTTSGEFPDQIDSQAGLAFSPNGRYLAYCHPEGDICIRDLRINSNVSKLSGHKGRVNSLDFATDGRRLLSSGEDGTILVWDVAKLAPTDAVRSSLNKASVELIQMLTGPDTSRAFTALHQLAGMGDQIVKPLENEVVAALGLAGQSEQIKRWITDLESRDFKTRQTAMDRLREKGGLAEATLRAALQKMPPPETRRRLELLLPSIESSKPLSPAVIFAIRAVDVLEQIGTPRSCAVLERLASNGDDARIQQEAKLSLEQLKKRPPH
ncbi:hypothetical protein BH10PLA2_BH10PLA2_15500 [soil metagenome]